jgi:hypothetical protein
VQDRLACTGPARGRYLPHWLAASGGDHGRDRCACSRLLPLKSPDDLSVAYTPGVGRVSQAIAADPERGWVKEFADIDAYPVCVDVAAAACVEVEERLRRELDIPVFHDGLLDARARSVTTT